MAQDSSSKSELEKVKAEIGRMPVEPLLPVEKKLIGWSLGLGVALLLVLAALSHLFPVGT